MTDEKMVTLKDWARGSSKSKLMWLGLLTTGLSTLAANTESWQPLFGSWGPIAGQVLGVAVMVLRAKTSTALPHK